MGAFVSRYSFGCEVASRSSAGSRRGRLRALLSVLYDDVVLHRIGPEAVEHVAIPSPPALWTRISWRRSRYRIGSQHAVTVAEVHRSIEVNEGRGPLWPARSEPGDDRARDRVPDKDGSTLIQRVQQGAHVARQGPDCVP